MFCRLCWYLLVRGGCLVSIYNSVGAMIGIVFYYVFFVVVLCLWSVFWIIVAGCFCLLFGCAVLFSCLLICLGVIV